MARALILGCGARGLALADALAAQGHAVRGTSRREEGVARIERAGHEAALADPDRLGTVLAALSGVSVVVWPFASATGAPEQVEALHGPRLRTLLERLIDSGARGLVYEAVGSVDDELLRGGAGALTEIERSHRIPVATIDVDPSRRDAWTAAGVAAVELVLAR